MCLNLTVELRTKTVLLIHPVAGPIRKVRTRRNREAIFVNKLLPNVRMPVGVGLGWHPVRSSGIQARVGLLSNATEGKLTMSFELGTR